MQQRLEDKRVIVPTAALFEDMELFYPYYRLIEEGADVTVAGLNSRTCTGKHGLSITPSVRLQDVSAGAFDAVVVPGGYAPDQLRTDDAALRLVREADSAGKPLAVICHAAWVLVSAGVAKGRRLTCYWSVVDDVKNAGADYVDEAVVVDGNLITSRYPPDLGAFCRALITALE